MKSTPEITVPWQRLDSKPFGKDGDIHAAYSADKKDSIRAPFKHEGKLYTTMGNGPKYSLCHELLPYTETDPPAVKYSHEGEAVKFKGKKYRLGPQLKFVPADRTIPEWRRYFRLCYQDGGYFTSGRTYHEAMEYCYTDHQRSISQPNELAALDLELNEPDFTKHKPKESPPVPTVSLKLTQCELTFA